MCSRGRPRGQGRPRRLHLWYLRFNVLTVLGGCISNVQHPLTKFLCCGMIISQRCCYSYSKMSWLKVKKLLAACFCEGKLGLFEVAKGCTRRL